VKRRASWAAAVLCGVLAAPAWGEEPAHEPVPPLIEALKTERAEDRRLAEAQLLKAGDDAIVPLSQALEKADPKFKPVFEDVLSRLVAHWASAAWEWRHAQGPPIEANFARLSALFQTWPAAAQKSFWSALPPEQRKFPPDYKDTCIAARLGLIEPIEATTLEIKIDGSGVYTRHLEIARWIRLMQAAAQASRAAEGEDIAKDEPLKMDEEVRGLNETFFPNDPGKCSIKPAPADKDVMEAAIKAGVLELAIAFPTLADLDACLQSVPEPFCVSFVLTVGPNNRILVQRKRVWPTKKMYGMEHLFLDGRRERFTLKSEIPVRRVTAPKTENGESVWDGSVWDLLNTDAVAFELSVKALPAAKEPKGRTAVPPLKRIPDDATGRIAYEPAPPDRYVLMQLNSTEPRERRGAAWVLLDEARRPFQASETAARAARRLEVGAALAAALEQEEDFRAYLLMHAALSAWSGEERSYAEPEAWGKIFLKK